MSTLVACGWLWACGNDPQSPVEGAPALEAGQASSGSANIDASAPGMRAATSDSAASSTDAGSTVASDADSDVGTGNTDAGGSVTMDGSTADADSGGRPDVGVADSSPAPDPDRCDIAVLDAATRPQSLMLSGSLGTHDPTLIAAHGRYYLFATGPVDVPGLLAKTSPDLITWRDAPAPLRPNPAWIAQRVPAASNLWAPDISQFGGLYHLYYSASSFGSRNSCIGHASRPALDSGSWNDHGAVVCSSESDEWNAIDPNVIVDQAGTPWLAFGSFWSGIKLIELNMSGARANDKLHSLAMRDRARYDGAVEAPVIVRRCGFYYLFVSFDKCCVGAASTYNLRVGRSENVLGPYLDTKGVAMMAGGGTPLVAADARFAGPGHNAVLFHGTQAFNVYHAYSIQQNGSPTLRVSELFWNAEGWPVSGGP